MIDILISQVDEHNESNILATKELNPEIIYFIKDKSCNNKADTLKKYYERNFKNIKLNFFDIKEGDNTALEKLIKNIENIVSIFRWRLFRKQSPFFWYQNRVLLSESNQRKSSTKKKIMIK